MLDCNNVWPNPWTRRRRAKARPAPSLTNRRWRLCLTASGFYIRGARRTGSLRLSKSRVSRSAALPRNTVPHSASTAEQVGCHEISRWSSSRPAHHAFVNFTRKIFIRIVTDTPRDIMIKITVIRVKMNSNACISRKRSQAQLRNPVQRALGPEELELVRVRHKLSLREWR